KCRMVVARPSQASKSWSRSGRRAKGDAQAASASVEATSTKAALPLALILHPAHRILVRRRRIRPSDGGADGHGGERGEAGLDHVLQRNFIEQVASGRRYHGEHRRHICLLALEIALHWGPPSV